MSSKAPSKAALTEILSSLKRYRIAKSYITMTDELLGFGGFGDVKLGYLRDGSKVAVKQLRPSGSRGERKRLVYRCVRELKVWAGLEHENIIELVGFHLSRDMETAWLISPYEERGNIREYLDERSPSESERMLLVLDTANGLAYLHSLNVCHGDIKAGNVLVTKADRTKLCDFRLAQLLGKGPSGITTSKGNKGSTRFMAPEIIESDTFIHTLKGDIWAWACLALEIMCDMLPYADATTESAVMRRILLRELPAPVDTLSLAYDRKALLWRCWTHLPHTRLSIQECVDICISTTPLEHIAHLPLDRIPSAWQTHARNAHGNWTTLSGAKTLDVDLVQSFQL